jgi:riboflavin kinase/FMN adenylyltransferase
VEIRRELSQHDPSSPRTALTIGAYDGVHTGHRQVISEVCRLAVERGLTSAVLTFDRHPASVVRPGSAPLLLTDTDQKLEELATTGVDLTMVLPFDAERATESAESFIREVLVGGLGVALVVVGEDFHFGHQRLGNVALLRDLGVELGFEVMGLGLVGLDGRPARDHEQVSSTFIRRALARGDLKRANAMLGRPYEVRGVVFAGDRRGREMGFPTANVRIDPSILLPEDAVYAGWYERPDGAVHAAAISLGTRPQFYEDGAVVLEAHLLEVGGPDDGGPDLYDEAARVRFVRRLRGQSRFDDLDALVAQLHRDVADTRAALG